jgi:hypothetical protein
MIFMDRDLFHQTEVCIDKGEEVEVSIAGPEALHLVIIVEAIHVIECTIVIIEKGSLVVEAIVEDETEEEILEIETGTEIMIREDVAEAVRDQSAHPVTVEVEAEVDIEAKVEADHLEEIEIGVE